MYFFGEGEEEGGEAIHESALFIDVVLQFHGYSLSHLENYPDR